MKKLFIKLFLFLAVFIVIDQSLGFAISKLVGRAKGGDTGRNIEIADKTKADVILFGSSRCIHHYDPRIISDSLGMSCFNAGRDGNGILMMYPYYKMLSERYTPKLIIYDLNGFDLDEDDHSKYLVWLRQFYGRPPVDSMIWDINPDERYKMMCKAYQYNGKVLQIISDAIHPLQHDILGYKPLDGTISYLPKTGKNKVVKQKPIDPFKEKYLVRLILDCKHRGTNLVFMFSPTYGHSQRSEYYNAITALCKRYGVPFFYHENDRRFIFNQKYFKDTSHLNHVGAEKYTSMTISEIKKYLYNAKTIK